MKNTQSEPTLSGRKNTRHDQRARALRDNLQKRKRQIRARTQKEKQ